MSDRRKPNNNRNNKSRNNSNNGVSQPIRALNGTSPTQRASNGAVLQTARGLNNTTNRQNGESSPVSPNSPAPWSKNKPGPRRDAKKSRPVDSVRKIVQEEGRIARNLVTWNVPVEDGVQGTYRSRPLRRRVRPEKNLKLVIEKKVTNLPNVVPADTRTEINHENVVNKEKKDIRARYWAFLFDNLERAVDEIYKTCEMDESEVQCKEVIMMLEHSTRDFKSLIERLRVIRDFEKADKRPHSLAWELRKTSPGKAVSPVVPERLGVAATAKRILNFTKQNDKRQPKDLPHPPGKVASYADRVRGVKISTVNEVNEDDTSSISSVDSHPDPGNNHPEAGINDDLDPGEGQVQLEDDGWETVPSRAGRHRGRSSKLSGKGSSTESLNSNGQGSYTGSTSRRTPARDSPGTELVRIANTAGPLTISPGQKAPSATSESEVKSAIEPNAEKVTSDGDVTCDVTCDPVTASPSGGRENLLLNLGHMTSPKQSQTSNTVTSDHDSPPKVGDNKKMGPRLNSDLEYDINYDVTDEVDEDLDALESKLIDELEVMDCALKEEQVLEMNNNIEDAVTEHMEKQSDEVGETEEVSTQTTSTPPDVSTQTIDVSPEQEMITWDSLVQAYKEMTEQHVSWGEMVDVEERTPGRSVQMHEKLSSPSRKPPSPRELNKKLVEKHQKAQQLREKLMADKAERLRELARKVEIVAALKEEIGEQRRGTHEQKMRAAEEKRNIELRKRMQKAHDEEMKANEIAFINSLGAQNKKHEIETKHQECQARLLDLAEERQRRSEEKAAKEAAVEERRKALEADRVARLQELQVRRKQRESEFEQRQQEKEKERIEVARVKERDREERIAAIKAQQQTQIDELRVKIQEKQDDSARRHSEKLDQIREKAFEMSILRHSTEDHSDAPRLTPYDRKKLCTVCNVLLPSEVHLSSHLRGRKHEQNMTSSNNGKTMSKTDIEDFNLLHIKDAPSDRPDLQMKNDSERRKALKKRCKKLRQRMSARGAEYENTLLIKQNNSENKQKLQKYVKDISKVLQVQSKGPWAQDRVSTLDRALFEVQRILDKNCAGDAESFCTAGGVTSICRVLMTLNDAGGAAVLPDKSLCACAIALRRVCQFSPDNCRYVLFSNKLGVLVDFLASRFALIPNPEMSQDSSPSSTGVASKVQDTVATCLMQALITVLDKISACSEANPDIHNRKNDIISYLVSVGVVDRIKVLFSCIRQPIEGNTKASEFFDTCLKLLHSTAKLLSSTRNSSIFDGQKSDDSTLLIQTMSSTELCSTISFLYSILLNTSNASKRDTPPAELNETTMTTVTNAIELLNSMAVLSLSMFQSVLGEEGTWLEFRHICSYLIWYCSQINGNEKLLHEVIIAVGYFTVLNTDNQQYIQSGQPPTVLQQLCSLPFQYFSNARLTDILFPTLISVSYNNSSNREILENELSCALLANYIEENLNSQKSKSAPLSLRFPNNELQNALNYFKV